MPGKVVVIGLDGATHKILQPLAAEGIIPNIKSMMDKGCWGNLISTFPPLTSPAWATLMTGKLPGKIGLFGFNDHVSNSYDPGLINSTNIKSRMFWETAGDEGKKVYVLNFPMTYPVRKTSGGVVSGFMTPVGAKDFFYPDTLSEYLKDYAIQPVPPLQIDDFELFFKDIFEDIEKKAAFTKEIALSEDWDLFMFCVQETDTTHHRIAKYLYPQFEEYFTETGEKVRYLNNQMYSAIDRLIGDIVQAAGSGTTFMMVSDHGSEPTPRFSFNINNLFAQEGILKSNRGTLFEAIRRNTKGAVREWLEKKFPHRAMFFDYTRSYAWCHSYRCRCPGIMINLKGRFPNGIVNPGEEYEAVAGRITSLLENLRHEGKKVVDKIYRRDDIYHGPYKDYSPDIIFTMHGDYEVPTTQFHKLLKQKTIFNIDKISSSLSGNHCIEGIYIINGPNIATGGQSVDVGIQSIAPTALYLLGLEVPTEMDGHVMTDFIDGQYLEHNSVRYSNTVEGNDQTYSLNPDEEANLAEQLKNLGYM